MGRTTWVGLLVISIVSGLLAFTVLLAKVRTGDPIAYSIIAVSAAACALSIRELRRVRAG